MAGDPLRSEQEKPGEVISLLVFSGLIVSKFSYLISANIFSSAAAAPTGSHGRHLYQAAVRAAAALQDKGGIGLPIRLFTGTAAGLRGRKDDYGGICAACAGYR